MPLPNLSAAGAAGAVRGGVAALGVADAGSPGLQHAVYSSVEGCWLVNGSFPAAQQVLKQCRNRRNQDEGPNLYNWRILFPNPISLCTSQPQTSGSFSAGSRTAYSIPSIRLCFYRRLPSMSLPHAAIAQPETLTPGAQLSTQKP